MSRKHTQTCVSMCKCGPNSLAQRTHSQRLRESAAGTVLMRPRAPTLTGNAFTYSIYKQTSPLQINFCISS